MAMDDMISGELWGVRVLVRPNGSYELYATRTSNMLFRGCVRFRKLRDGGSELYLLYLDAVDKLSALERGLRRFIHVCRFERSLYPLLRECCVSDGSGYSHTPWYDIDSRFIVLLGGERLVGRYDGLASYRVV